MDALLGVLSRGMDHAVRRQTFLAGNIANHETPGYIRKDLNGPSFSDLLRGLEDHAFKTTHGGHQGGWEFNPEIRPVRVREGGTVTLEKESARISANSVYFAVLTRLSSIRGQMLSRAITGGG